MAQIAEPPSAFQQRSSRTSYPERAQASGSSRAGLPTRLHDTSAASNNHGKPLNGSPDNSSKSSSQKEKPSGLKPKKAQAKTKSPTPNWTVQEDVRTRLPSFLRRFSGYRDPNTKPPYPPLPIPPFTWLKKIPLKYETWLLSTIGAFVGIALVEVVIAAAFPNDGTILIVASFGATAVLCFALVESPLAQPRHLVGGQVLSCIVGICITKLFQLSPTYRIDQTIEPGELDRLPWINGALAMALSLLVQQITGTVHPPAGATALIAAVQPAAVRMSWRLIYVVLISSIVMTAWALIINNVGRRRYPSYWFSGTRVFVRGPDGKFEKETQDQLEMSAEEGRSPMLNIQPMPDEGQTESNPYSAGFADHPGVTAVSGQQKEGKLNQ